MTTRGGFPVNAQQVSIIDHVVDEKVTVASAGAGSGKTYTMIAAVLELLDRASQSAEVGLSIDDFAIITFTNEAAAQLRERVELALAGRATSSSEEFWLEQQERLPSAFVGTIHSFCHQLLRRHGYAGAVPRTSSTTRSTALLREAISAELDSAFQGDEELSGLTVVDLPEHQLITWLTEAHAYLRTLGVEPSDCLDPTAALAGGDGAVRLAAARLLSRAHAKYIGTKQQRGVVDVDDLLLVTLEVLAGTQGRVVAQRAAESFPIIFVDEFQDTDRVQAEIVERLLPGIRRLLLVGDVKQSIYGFRSASSTMLKEFAARHSDRVHSLNISRRPTADLLAAQNSFFHAISDRYPELGELLEAYEATPSSPSRQAPIIHVPALEADQTPAMAAWILGLLDEELWLDGDKVTATPGDIVILCRTNRQVESVCEDVTDALGGAHEVRPARGISFFRSPEVVATFRVVQMLLHPEDGAVIAAALETFYFPTVDVTPKVHEVVQHQHKHGNPLADWLRNEHPDLASWVDRCRARVRSETAPQLLARLYEESGLTKRLRDQGRLDAISTLEALREEARGLLRSEQALTAHMFADWLKVAILQAFPSARDATPERRPPFVRAMTMHQAKGLQFPIVIIPGIERALASDYLQPRHILHEDLAIDVRLPIANGLPSTSSRWASAMASYRQAQVAEEMRLLYVAMTRAEQHVLLVGQRKSPRLLPPTHQAYAWVDEVSRANSRGATFVTALSPDAASPAGVAADPEGPPYDSTS